MGRVLAPAPCVFDLSFWGVSLGAPGTILELFWVPLGIPWGALRAPWELLGDPWGSLWAAAVGPWRALGTIWVHLGYIFCGFGFNMGPKGNFLHDVGSCGVIVQGFFAGIVYDSLLLLSAFSVLPCRCYLWSPLFLFFL